MASMNEVIWWLPILVVLPVSALLGGGIGYMIWKEFINGDK